MIMKDEKLVVLREWNSVTEAEMAKSILDGAGIFSTIRNEYMSAIYPIGTMPAQLVVKEEDAKRAAELLDKMPQPIIWQLVNEFRRLLRKPPSSL